mmetsp:Transcript_44476/g.81219  ORF Transcript_44476/g.81219 Transcript_44476/m.81219 type:complete len:200 (-) Transcript_44476:134-733(-)
MAQLPQVMSQGRNPATQYLIWSQKKMTFQALNFSLTFLNLLLHARFSLFQCLCSSCCCADMHHSGIVCCSKLLQPFIDSLITCRCSFGTGCLLWKGTHICFSSKRRGQIVTKKARFATLNFSSVRKGTPILPASLTQQPSVRTKLFRCIAQSLPIVPHSPEHELAIGTELRGSIFDNPWVKRHALLHELFISSKLHWQA